MYKLAILRSIWPNEYRLPLLLEDLLDLPRSYRQKMVFESGYGERFGIDDQSIINLGYDVMDRDYLLSNFYHFIILKPTVSDYQAMPRGAVVLGWIHAAQNKDVIGVAKTKELTLIALEACYDQREQHILFANNRIAGENAVYDAISKIDGIAKKSSACVIGNGHCGQGAANQLLRMNIHVDLYTRFPAKECDGRPLLSYVTVQKRAQNYLVNDAPIYHQFSQYSIIVNAVKQDILDPTMHVTSKSQLSYMQPGTLLIDLSCDNGMGFYFAKPTTHSSPILRVGHVQYYAIDNTPSLTYQKSSAVISKVLCQYLPAFIKFISQELPDDIFTAAVEVRSGKVINPDIIRFQCLDEPCLDKALQ